VKRFTLAVSILTLTIVSFCGAQQPPAQVSQATFTDVYHVHFVKAVPGKTKELQQSLLAPSVDTPMPTHVLVLVHREGDDWDFASIAHEGTSFTVKASDQRITPARELRDRHNDTIATGPSWPEFARAMGLSGPQAGAQPAGSAVYIITTYRGLPGHRDQLYETLQRIDRASRKPGSSVILRHAEGSEWDYAVITRYDSWQDLAADQTDPEADQRAKRAGFTQSPGLELREHMLSHHDTIADRIAVQASASAAK
jgi:hypothetical protein